MPRNFKEALFFTLLMCSLMVLGMSVWNLFVAGHLTWSHVLMGYLPGFVTAFLLDVVLVGPLVKGIAFRFLKDHHKRWQKITVISGGMVLLMVTFMSLYGLLFSGVPLSLGAYGQAWLTNFVVALPFNFILVGPISRYILSHVQKPLPGEDTVEDFEDDDEIPTII